MQEPRDRTARRTLADVAVLAGTSVPTVSKVLRGGTDVSLRTRRAVMAAVEEAGYVPRHGARLRESGAALIDFVLSDVHGSWVHEALGGVEGAATAADHDVVLTIARRDGAWVQRVLRHRSAGAVITLVDPTTAQLEVLHAAGKPFVLMDPMSRAPGYAASVGVSNWEGGRSAAEHLLRLGHRRFAAIGGGRTHLYSQARLDGFRSGVAAVPDGTVVAVDWADWRRHDARAAAAPILARPDRPTAMFACSDLMAIGIADAARELGLRVPEDLSIVGFDDLPEAGWATPPLTTVRQPISELGAAAVRMLLQEPNGSPTARRVELATSLVIRDSTAPPA
ncbi:LacI family DNA-binding transcriptional regulator [Amnibacterium kyonggiense]|uniref:LacI family transcriptional regulator n=1 Tax=Amnibacterium kyonggiense TaxID=595671 RepID=A0A4R7FRY0_9MICO|nr:LacI family DNA-binding transcriptional regulator [Amnibacterium kyonggiense]TDS80573.1 LacI family transcriptional regulator [Amnibacterium kyonggiense]